jgi:hypothetical protein
MRAASGVGRWSFWRPGLARPRASRRISARLRSVGCRPDRRGYTALGWLVAGLLGTLVSLPLMLGGRRIIATHVEAVAQDPSHRGSDAVRIGPPWPWFQACVVITVPAVALFVLPVYRPYGWKWALLELGAAVTVVRFLRRGPSVLGASFARLDHTGVGLPLHGIHVPWTSIEQTRVDGAFHVLIRIAGPVSRTDRQPGRWTDLIVSACTTGLELRIPDTRPERAI